MSVRVISQSTNEVLGFANARRIEVINESLHIFGIHEKKKKEVVLALFAKGTWVYSWIDNELVT